MSNKYYLLTYVLTYLHTYLCAGIILFLYESRAGLKSFLKI